MASPVEITKVVSTALIDLVVGEAISMGMESLFPAYDEGKSPVMTALEAGAQGALTVILAVQSSRFIYAKDNLDPTQGVAMLAFLWDQDNLKKKVVSVTGAMKSYIANPTLGGLAGTGRGAGRSALTSHHMPM